MSSTNPAAAMAILSDPLKIFYAVVLEMDDPWNEIVSGMLRMLLVSEILDALVGPPVLLESPRGQIQLASNKDINVDEAENWFELLLGRIAEHRGQDVSVIENKALHVIARCEAVRYVQLGNPETLIFGNENILWQKIEGAGESAEAAEADTT